MKPLNQMLGAVLIVAGLVTSPVVAKPLAECFASLQSVARKNSAAVHREPLNAILAKAKGGPVDGAAIIDLLSQVPELKQLYAADVGVWEGYNLREHTLMVYAIYNEFIAKFPEGLKVPAGVNLKKMFPVMLALHDIGKPVAVEEGDKRRQHDFTIPLMDPLMRDLGMSPQEIELAKVITKHDRLGAVVTGRLAPEAALKELRGYAKEASMPLKDYFQLQSFFYKCDAASYPTLRQGVFQTVDGRLVPTSPNYAKLVELVNAE
jgi:hypothetical protein